jgi:hypothetical protein
VSSVINPACEESARHNGQEGDMVYLAELSRRSFSWGLAGITVSRLECESNIREWNKEQTELDCPYSHNQALRNKPCLQVSSWREVGLARYLDPCRLSLLP